MTAEIENIPCKILLVDDEENIVRAIARLLMQEEMDLDVMTASSGAQGVELLAKHKDVALILSDQRMPGMSGAEFLEKARDLAPDAVRMVLTGYADMAATMDAINKGGASRYLTKPWDDDVLRRAIMEGVAQYRLVQENRRLTLLVEKQNRELSEWNDGLKGRVMKQTATIRSQNDELKERNRLIGETFRHTIAAFSQLIELHSSRLQEHTRNVTQLCLKAATDLKLKPEEIETLQTAAQLHDIGVIGIPMQILDKQTSAMTKEELGVFLQHTVRGQTALDAVQELREAGLIIRHHHEFYNGKGFPDGISGKEIPLGSRLIAFADFADREIDEQRGEQAVAALLPKVARELGQQLDPELFQVMEPHIRDLYGPERFGATEYLEKELRPKQLLPGMTVTRNLYSGGGMLLLLKGTVLDAGKIITVVRHYTVDPPSGGVFVDWSTSGTDTQASSGYLWSGKEQGAGSRRQPEAEQELRPKQLKEGMRITRHLYSGTGLLLLTAGTVLDSSSIVSVVRYYNIDPPENGVFVAQEAS